MERVNPLVSILMTVYNREVFIVEAIESVLANNYSNWELIITDDCSADNSYEIAKKYASKDQRIRLYKNEINLGDYTNRNRAATYANGEFMLYVDSDDKLLPDTIQNLLEDISIDSNFNFAMYWAHSNDKFILTGADALNKHFFDKQFLYMGPGGTFMRKSFFDSIGGYPEKYGPANDMYFNLKVCCYSSIHLLPYEFIFYRRHDGQEINNCFNYLYNNYNYMRDALVELSLPFSKKTIKWLKMKNKRRFIVALCKFFLSTRSFTKSIEAYRKANFSLFDIIQGVFH